MQTSQTLSVLKEYFQAHPDPLSCHIVAPNVLKLIYNFTSPFTSTYIPSEQCWVFDHGMEPKQPYSKRNHAVFVDLKGKLQQQHSFEGIETSDIHGQVMNDVTFGVPKVNSSSKKWVYIAEITSKPFKSCFKGGEGNRPITQDFGQQYTGVTQVGIFIWNKEKHSIQRIEVPEHIIPHTPVLNEEGTEVIFSAFQRQSFGHGLYMQCNRPSKLYQAQTHSPKQMSEKQTKDQWQVECISWDQERTNLSPVLSTCMNYMCYLSGSGVTHNYYMDVVVARKQNNRWVQVKRLKQKIAGYDMRLHCIQQEGRMVFVFACLEKATYQLYKYDVQTDICQSLTAMYPDHSFTIMQVDPDCGVIAGTVTCFEYKSFFVYKGGKVHILEPEYEHKFTIREYFEPFHACYLEANQELTIEQQRSRAVKKPLVVKVHGGPHGSFFKAVSPLDYLLLRTGHGLLLVNYSGSCGYGQQRLQSLVGKIFHLNTSQIIEFIQKLLLQRPQIDPKNVHLLGHSYGGGLVMNLDGTRPDLFRSLVVMNAASDMGGFYFQTDIPEWVAAEFANSFKWNDMSLHKQGWRQGLGAVQSQHPMLILEGALDRNVPYRQKLLMGALQRQRGAAVSTAVYDDSGHVLAGSAQTIIDTAVKIHLFYEEHMLRDND